MKLFNPITGQTIKLGVHKQLERLAELRAQGWVEEGEVVTSASSEPNISGKKRPYTKREPNETFIIQDGNTPAVEEVLDNGDSVELNV